jgi:hypothetical protein
MGNTILKRGHQLIIFCGLIWTDLIMAENTISGLEQSPMPMGIMSDFLQISVPPIQYFFRHPTRSFRCLELMKIFTSLRIR